MNNFSNLPKSWQVKTLGEVCEILDNMQKHINATEREQRLKNANRKYAYYGATGQVGYIDEFYATLNLFCWERTAHHF